MKTGSNEIEHTSVSKQLRIVLEEHPDLEIPVKLEEEVESIWQHEKQNRTLYDSFLFSVRAVDTDRIVGRFVKYRYFIASRKSKELQEALQIYPLGVSCVCICRSQVLVGVRDVKLSTYGGYLECVPSGSVEARSYMHGEVDYVAQAMWELQEEARIGEKMVREVHPLGLYYSPQDELYDLGLFIRLDLTEQEMVPEGTKEYPLLNWYSRKEFEKKLHDPSAKVVPTSKALWHTYLHLK